MKAFSPTKVIRRAIKIKSSDRAIADADWAIEISISGVRVHRLGHRSERWGCSWRSVISHLLVHNARKDT
jgi:hypothetical protein